jgi:hypothetical protein
MFEDLQKKYDYLFPKPDSNEPISHFGIECAYGWKLLLENTFSLIVSRYKQALGRWEYAKHNDKDPEFVLKLEEEYEKAKSELPVICQVKSKFATLRIYADNTTPYVKGVLEMAELMSGSICEFCGDKGKRCGGGWITTLCSECAEENNKTPCGES